MPPHNNHRFFDDIYLHTYKLRLRAVSAVQWYLIIMASYNNVYKIRYIMLLNVYRIFKCFLYACNYLISCM